MKILSVNEEQILYVDAELNDKELTQQILENYGDEWFETYD